MHPYFWMDYSNILSRFVGLVKFYRGSFVICSPLLHQTVIGSRGGYVVNVLRDTYTTCVCVSDSLDETASLISQFC